ncbi:response regulator transcription factor [Shewanella intestini]|uniref:Helix-turn-helix transcriptional regulator n=1 Tax=Shewanella intestini TaxID=2017544 RepID=A0ABS5I616_9GAMM|nr:MULTISPECIES: LuxR C-terminal-related transcriptional regulator [Shewanella]MBR9729164.1 helix-turn-helix transcriptional regulator [Shewanella intestini]MRG37265.1 hypothetical protein [Shewanella sp. XMDDZSB0408]
MLNKQMLLVDFTDELQNQFSSIAQLLHFSVTHTVASHAAEDIAPYTSNEYSMLIAHYINAPIAHINALKLPSKNQHYHLAICPKLTTEIELSLMSAGFNGAIEENAKVVDKLQAINQLMEQHIYYSQTATSRYVLKNKPRASYQNNTKLLALTTPKEQQILSLIWSGLNNDEMAAKLDISINTVKMHVQNIYKKTNINSRGQLFAMTAD